MAGIRGPQPDVCHHPALSTSLHKGDVCLVQYVGGFCSMKKVENHTVSLLFYAISMHLLCGLLPAAPLRNDLHFCCSSAYSP